VTQYQKGRSNLGFTEATDSEWQWHHMHQGQIYTSLQTDNYASNPLLNFYRLYAFPATKPAVSVH